MVCFFAGSGQHSDWVKINRGGLSLLSLSLYEWEDIMEVAAKNAPNEFVTVVSVGNQPENFVTILSIGNGRQEDKQQQQQQLAADKAQQRQLTNGTPEVHHDEIVEVYRLPGERLGFGLKFDGGNKNHERIKRLFIQSCAEQSPASRAKCSWESLGEGDEVKQN